MNKLIRYVAFKVLELDLGKWKCRRCSKVSEGESFMDLIAASSKEEGGQHVHGWENITLLETSVRRRDMRWLGLADSS
jgi:hypothetical protein